MKESQQGISGPGRAQYNADIKQTKITYPGLSKLFLRNIICNIILAQEFQTYF